MLLLTFLRRRGRIEHWPEWAANTAGAAVLAASAATQGQWAWMAAMILTAIGSAWVWWHHWKRRKRRRALAMLGAKSRALIAAMVRTMRRERKPSRVLRPHPVPS
jgi:hypothetical protein